MKRRRAHEKMHVRAAAVDPEHIRFIGARVSARNERDGDPASARRATCTEVLHTCVCIRELRARGPRSGFSRARARARFAISRRPMARCGAMRYKTRGPPAASRAARHYLSRPPRARRRQLCAGTAALAAQNPRDTAGQISFYYTCGVSAVG